MIGFEEKQRPTLVVDPSGQQLISRGRIWIEPQTGTIWRVEWIYSPPIGAPASIRVDFRKDEALAMMVPSEMHEEFASLAGRNARGRGRAVYSNYRRFGTGARLVPQQPSRPLVQCAPPSRSSRHHSCPLNRSRRSNNYSAGRGEGRATYKNFRRFGTSARIVPQ